MREGQSAITSCSGTFVPRLLGGSCSLYLCVTDVEIPSNLLHIDKVQVVSQPLLLAQVHLLLGGTVSVRGQSREPFLKRGHGRLRGDTFNL